jgi:thiamine transport system substrate-binding protein
MRDMRALIGCLAFLVAAMPAASQVLTVYTYDSFTAEWGPGPQLKSAFERSCGCEVRFVGLEDAVAILSRLRFEGAASPADIALGLDTNLIADAAASGLFAPHGLAPAGLTVPGGFADELFVPYDYGYFAFVYDSTKLANPPASLAELVGGSRDITLLIQDPRTSSPGLGLLLWMRKVFGDGAADAWAKLAPRIVTVTQGWSEAYGLFQKGEADMVLSYTTSPAYHIEAENETRYRAAGFAEGHLLQVEVAGLLAASRNRELARDFLRFLVSPDAQAVIPTTQWMYPVRPPAGGLPAGFADLVAVDTPLAFAPEEVSAHRRAWVAEWLEALSR